MEFLYEGAALRAMSQQKEQTFLLTNGLGGYVSVSAAYSVSRCDHGLLVAAVKAPNERVTMVHRLRETLTVGKKTVYLSAQDFADKTPRENGEDYLTAFSYRYTPQWTYCVDGVIVKRRCAMAWEKNASAVLYTVENPTDRPCVLELTPFCKFAPKEQALEETKEFTYRDNCISGGKYRVYLYTNGETKATEQEWQSLAYPEDAKDGRPEEGLTGACCTVTFPVAPGEVKALELVFNTEERVLSGAAILQEQEDRLAGLEESCGRADPVARQLALAADAYIARRDSTKGKTILAGYPLFSDWGRDTMIALTGCTLSTGRFEDAKSILRTFLAYEKDGLVPNLFPEGATQPMYNTVDAALLLIDSVWQYYQRTGDAAFVEEAYPVLERIVSAYQKGTKHAIGMDEDGLIFAGDGLDQVTWMDVRVNDILPTPRHGKPVEINAYWYNALCIMAQFAAQTGRDGAPYEALAQRVKDSFAKTFYMEDKGYLKDVISGTKADEQLRCNQIWAVSMPFTMLTPEQERSVVAAVERELYNRLGLRTLSPKDAEYHPFYGGDMVSRDMAYHQGTTWVFPMGGYYLAYLKAHEYSEEAVRTVREGLTTITDMLWEGCLGQLPEIYDGDNPREGKGCFAQAWSVGEILRVFEKLEELETN